MASMEGFSPEGALDGVDLSTPSRNAPGASGDKLHGGSFAAPPFESLVNTLERVALRVIQEIMSHQYSPSGPALGTHQGELLLQSRPPLPFALAAPEAPNSSAYVVYKIGGDPGDYQFLQRRAQGDPARGSAPAAITADQICTILKDQFGMMPKRKAIGYTKPYPNEYELIPLPPKYRLPDFTKFSGSDGSSSIEHSLRIGFRLVHVAATELSPDLEAARFHEQYHSEASEAGIADLAQVRQKRGETVSEYIQRFRTVRNRCYSVHVSEKEAVELAVVGLSSSIKDVASQADYPSLAHMVQKLSAYEQRHPDVYQDKFKRVVTMVDAGEDEVATGEQEVAVAEWTRAAGPVTCKWVKPPGPPRGFDFDVTKTEQISYSRRSI
ncbi:hypothetical protein QYE76_032805 [Lolium multiflorum]|uniref:Retrotransposon gag domain-containing protein n=1 Tax=Lolium multiflorum TaxID=4521 RepID=A0AAD8QWE8_LOLMU|nr:hypothetical protein QYE76_032805 [Lolium multiflorum]